MLRSDARPVNRAPSFFIAEDSLAKVLEMNALDFAAIVRPGDTVMWGQANAEPLPLTQALMAQRHAIGNFNVFLGISYSDTLKAEYADCIRFSGYAGTGGNRALAKAGKLDILPCHYSHLRDLIASRRLKVDVLLLQLAPANARGEYSLSIAHEYLIPALEAARVVVAEVNEQAPWTYGERPLVEADLDYIVHTSARAARARASAGGSGRAGDRAPRRRLDRGRRDAAIRPGSLA